MTTKEYMTLEEASKAVGSCRASIYNYMKALDIKRHKFKHDKRSYLASSDVKRIKEMQDKPWIAGEDE